MTDSNPIPLTEQIDQDLQQAIREQNTTAKLALRSVKTGLTEVTKVGEQHEPSEEEILAVIQREAKRRREAAEEYERLGATDQAALERAELTVLEPYLPRQLTEEEIEELARKAISDTGATSTRDMGRVMSVIMGEVKGRADGKVVSQVVQRLLAD